MSIRRWAAKVDASQPPLVRDLRAHGIKVWQIRKPCDLLLRFWCIRHQAYCWQTLEAKTPMTRDGRPLKRNDQKEQRDFLSDTNTPIATDFASAFRELNKQHTLPSVSVACVLQSN
jgi:hypothetical protein